MFVATWNAPYAQRKDQVAETGVCIEPSCQRVAAPESLRCQACLAENRAQQRSKKRRQRAERRAARQCLDCATPLKRNETIWCAAHRIARARGTKAIAVGLDTDEARAARVASAMRPDPTDGNRMRYVGSGYKSQLQLDQQDLRYARDALAAGEAGLHHLETPEIKASGTIERTGVKSAALHQLFRAVGHIEDVLLRRGHDITRKRHDEA